MKFSVSDLFVYGLAALLTAAMVCSDRTTAEWLALGLIVLAGIPHGSFDLRAAQRWWGSSPSRRLTLVLAYVAIGLGMSALCLLWPGVGLSAFLIISAIHFAEGEKPSSTRLGAIALGIGAILLPISFHMPEARKYLGFFASESALAAIEPYVSWSGIALSHLLVCTIVFEAWLKPQSEPLQKVACLAAWILLPPLSGFCVWFIGRHSWQHLKRSNYLLLDPGSTGRIPLDFIVLSILAIALIAPLSFWFDLGDIHQLFAASIVLIAGLTLPHMIVTHISEKR
jgi:Brp/Blh family beta-carotene 15,15'-monooxygenase